MAVEIKIPDIGDFSDVPIVEIFVNVGDVVEVETPLLLLESDKATLDVPSPIAGKIIEIRVTEGQQVSQGDVVVIVEAEVTDAQQVSNTSAVPKQSTATPKPSSSASGDNRAQVLVIGAGPGGYSAAFRAADLGQKVILVDCWDNLGGVCLNVGCIPSKALLHVAKVIDEAEEMSSHGVSFGKPQMDLDRIRSWKDSVVSRLTGGLAGLARRRKVKTIQGTAEFSGRNQVAVKTSQGVESISFDQAIISVGSTPVQLPFLPEDPRIIDSTGALALQDVPERMLIIGGGIIGLELGQVYHQLGAKITVAEMMPQIIPGADQDIVSPLMKRIEKQFESIRLATTVTSVKSQSSGLVVTFKKDGEISEVEFDKILVAVGRVPNGGKINAGAAGVSVDERGFIATDKQMRTNVPHIFAIGDVVGQPMLAHKAVHEGHVAAEVAAGEKATFDAKVIPSVAYTDPEIAWVGLTETEAKDKKIKVKKGVFPWAASGRSLSMGRSDGMTKLIFDPETKRLLGAGIVGQNAGDLLAEVALAIEMGADAEDIALTIHPHPTLSETVGLAAEVFEGTITDL